MEYASALLPTAEAVEYHPHAIYAEMGTLKTVMVCVNHALINVLYVILIKQVIAQLAQIVLIAFTLFTVLLSFAEILVEIT
jgi:hypothetical protein